MCGILGVVATTPVNQLLYDGLQVLQHRPRPVLAVFAGITHQPLAGFARPARHENSRNRRFKTQSIDGIMRLAALDEFVPFHRKTEAFVDLVADAEDDRVHVQHLGCAQPFGFGVAVVFQNQRGVFHF